MMRVTRYLGSLWKGNKPWWVAYSYWVFGMVLTILFNLAGERSLPADPRVGASISIPPFPGVVAVPLLAYVVFMSVAMWRCAPNASHPVWTFSARVVLVFGLIVGGAATFRGI